MKPVIPAFLLCVYLSLSAWAQEAREPLFTAPDGTRIHYDRTGNGPAVVLIHGFIVTGESWKRAPVTQRLIEAGHTVVTLDLRGNGRSDKPRQLAAYQQDAEVTDVMALMKHLGFRQYDVVGYSRGAILAARLLAVSPRRRIRRAMLGGMGIGFTNPLWHRRWDFYEALNRPGSHPELAPAIAYALKTGADTVALKHMQQAQPVTSRRALGRIRQPVLVISGENDTDNGPAHELAESLPNATLRQVPGTHNTAMFTPEFASEVVDFLRLTP